MSNMNYQYLSTDTLSNDDIVMLYQLYERYYDGCQFERFAEDILNKDIVLVVKDGNDLAGFSTLCRYFKSFHGQRLQVIYSGDTIMHQRYWGNSILAFAWLRYAGFCKAEHPDNPLYWFLIVKGHRTYRYLPVFSKAFYPSVRQATPLNIQQLMNELASARFGSLYKPETGLIQFDTENDRLKPCWSSIPEHLQKKPDIAFFNIKNPNYHLGDEMVCLCELSLDNLKPFTQRIFKEGYEHNDLITTHA